MIADDKNAGRFYCNFKVHKEHEHIPPPRPITSGSGSLTEGIGRFVDHHIKHVATKHKSYLKETPDFLRCIEKINSGERLHPKAMAATWDVHGLFTNILHHEGLDAMNEALENRETKKVPTDFIVKLMELILSNNIFEFHSSYWKQEVGAAMGSRPVPHYADTFMAKIDKEIKKLSEKYNIDNIEAIQLFKRFLDDFFFIFVGSTKSLHLLLKEANKINPTIQFTMSHTSVENENKEDQCDCEIKSSIPFLDTSVSIKEGKIDVDLYQKETDRNQYLLPSSCHSKTTTAAIPYSLALRIVRTCTDPNNRGKQFIELKKTSSRERL